MKCIDDMDRAIHKKKDGQFEIFDFDSFERIPLIYDFVDEFYENLAAVNLGGIPRKGFAEGGLWGFVDIYGNEIVKPQYDYVNSFDYGFANVIKNCKTGVINNKGEIIIPLCYDRINYEYRTNLFYVVNDDKAGYLNTKNEIIIPCIYKDRNCSFFEGRIVLKYKNGVFHYFDPKGSLLLEIKGYYDVEQFAEGLASVNIGGETDDYYQTIGGKWGFIDEVGNEIIPCTYDKVRYFRNGIVEVLKDGKWFKINKIGNIVN